MRNNYSQGITGPSPACTSAPPYTNRETLLAQHREAILAEIGAAEAIPDPELEAILLQVGVGEPIPDDDPLPPFEDVPQVEDDALIAKLAADAPRAFFYEGDGIWLRYPSANRMVRAGAPREGDPHLRFEALALQQASHHSTRRRMRRKGVMGN